MKRGFLAAILLAVAGWYFVWPWASPLIANYFPLPGKNEVVSVQVGERGGVWRARVRYYYTGKPDNAIVYVRLPAGAQGTQKPIEIQLGSHVRAVRGTHDVTLQIDRPPERAEPVITDKVLVEIGVYPGQVLATGGVAQEIHWPDRSSWALQREIATRPRDEILKKAIALTDKGDTFSLVPAHAIVKQLIKADPTYTPALDELARIKSKASWGEAGMRRMDSREEMRTQVNMLTNANGLEELDELAGNLRAAKAQTSSGLSALHQYHEVLAWNMDDPNRTAQGWATTERWIRQWLERYPASISANLLLAKMYHAHAWQIRGNDVAGGVQPAQWQGFQEQMVKAHEQLVTCYAVCREDPYWYAMMLSVLRSVSAPQDEYFRVFMEGFAAHPGYEPIYLDVALKQLPIWGGSVKQFADFTNAIAAKSPAPERDAVYARTYSELVRFGASFSGQSPAQWDVDCGRWLRGHDQIIAKFPSDYNISAAAFAATKCEDRKAAKRYMDKLVNGPYLPTWGAGIERGSAEYARAKAWAM